MQGFLNTFLSFRNLFCIVFIIKDHIKERAAGTSLQLFYFYEHEQIHVTRFKT